jgi:hypothetical protein
VSEVQCRGAAVAVWAGQVERGQGALQCGETASAVDSLSKRQRRVVSVSSVLVAGCGRG